jgi:hypothetical protein
MAANGERSGMVRRVWTSTQAARLADLTARRDEYRAMERAILEGKPFSYTIGGRTKMNYSLSLKDIREAIAELEAEMNKLEQQKTGGAGKTRGAIPRDI